MKALAHLCRCMGNEGVTGWRMVNAELSHRRSAQRRPAVIVLTAMLVLLTVLLAAIWGLRGTLADGPTLHVGAPEQVLVGTPIELTLQIHNAADVGGYQARVLFDSSVAHIEGVSHSGSDLAASGRFVQTLGPHELDSGATFGAFSCASRNCDDSATKSGGAGVSGDITLGTVSIVPNSPGQLTIDLSGLRLSGTNGGEIPVNGGSMSITVYVTDELE